jgi:hypothetical protein
MGVLGRCRLVRRALLSEFCENKFLEINHRFSRQRIAIPDFVTKEEVFWIIQQCLKELKDVNLNDGYIYSFFSNRLGQVFNKLYGRNCTMDEMIPWNVRQVITVSWSDHVIREEESGKEIKFKKDEDPSAKRGSDACGANGLSNGEGYGSQTASCRQPGGYLRQGKPKKPLTLFKRTQRK